MKPEDTEPLYLAIEKERDDVYLYKILFHIKYLYSIDTYLEIGAVKVVLLPFFYLIHPKRSHFSRRYLSVVVCPKVR